MNATPDIDLSVVIPCYNEAEVLPLLRTRLATALDALGLAWEVVFIDDGSVDSTFLQLTSMHQAEPRFRAVSLSRNFGHQAAVAAGLAHARGNNIAIMDSDLQDPPEILGDCLAKLREGSDVVFAVRRKRKEHLLKRIGYRLFYRILSAVSEVEIPLDSGDFCVMTRRVANVLTRMPERNIFMRGMRAWAGFRQSGVEYERDARAAGGTKYPFRKLLRLATDGVLAFSTLPLRLATYFGFLSVLGAMSAGTFVLAWRILGFRFMGHAASEVPGWAAAVCCGLFLNGIQLVILGLVGEYIGRIYTEVKKRPRWVVAETLGIPHPDGEDLPS